MAAMTLPDGWIRYRIEEYDDTGKPTEGGPWRADICPKHEQVPLAKLLGKALR